MICPARNYVKKSLEISRGLCVHGFGHKEHIIPNPDNIYKSFVVDITILVVT